MSDSESHFVAICPLCSTMLKVRRAHLGQRVACKQCGHTFVGTEAEQPIASNAGAPPTGNAMHAWPETQRILVVCDKCQASLSVKASRVGQVIRCKQCDQEILVKAPAEAAPAAVGGALASTSAERAGSAPAERGKSDGQFEALHSKHTSLQAEYEKLGVVHNLLEAEVDRLKQTHAEVVAENKELNEERDKLSEEMNAARAGQARAKTEMQAAQEEMEQLRTQADRDRANYQAEIERQQQTLQKEREQHHEGLLADVERLQQTLQQEREQHQEELVQRSGELDELRREHNLLESEINRLRTEHGTEINRLRTEQADVVAERDRLSQERDKLSEELDRSRALHALAQAEKQAAASEIEQHRAQADRDRANSQAEIENLQKTLEEERGQHQDELVHRSDEVDELRRARNLLDTEFNRLLTEHADVVAEKDRLRQERDKLSEDLNATRAALARLETEHQAAATAIDEHRAQADRDRANSQAEIERLNQAIAASLAAFKEHQDRNQKLVEAETWHTQELCSQLDAERLRREQLEEQLGKIQEESASLKESLARASAAPPSAPEPRRLGPAEQDELESARAEIVRLRKQVEQLERLQREISSVLHGLGLRVDVG